MNDTRKEIEDIYFDMMMKKSGIERLKMGFSMFESTKKIALSTISDDRDKRKELFLRFYGDDFDDNLKEEIINKILDTK